ncbi:NAD(P)H-hydrate dehydratase [Marasmitruncus massiliensis]|uniref:NAD(P)H-hydrate dehydratase n=1 Tax=Marasmitruncus massiliensis TaxID=1944642 RepID=UPI000C7A648F|nr:NAD(P)H-hydrate dehydratase [Marasmitruncus massiliensis]
MRIVTAEQMKAIEQNAVSCGLSMERLMENAGSAAAMAIRREYEVDGRYVTIFCGRGNNGGDGFVAARRLCQAGANVAVVLTDGAPRTEQAKSMYEMIRMMDIAISEYGVDPHYLAERLAETDILIDAIYGTGFHGELDDRHRDICRLMNGVDVDTVALDIPSGVTSDTGFADSFAVRAAMTVVFDSGKPASAFPASEEYCGKVVLADIGIPEEAHEGIHSEFTMVDQEYVFSHLQKRRRRTHKGDYGKLLNVAGSQNYMGAAILSSLAGMRTGAGYVTLASSGEVCRTALPELLECVMLPLKTTDSGALSYESIPEILSVVQKSSAVLAGNGMGDSEDAQSIIFDLVRKTKCPLILDADGINAVSRNIDILKQACGPVVLTPHLMELSRLTGAPLEQLRRDALTVGRAFAREYQVTLVLKDAYTNTVSADGQVLINTTGNAGLAKAGSGDVLAGIIGALAAQGISPEIAAASGVWLHGAAGDMAARNYSQYGMLARDVIQALPQVFLENNR